MSYSMACFHCYDNVIHAMLGVLITIGLIVLIIWLAEKIGEEHEA